MASRLTHTTTTKPTKQLSMALRQVHHGHLDRVCIYQGSIATVSEVMWAYWTARPATTRRFASYPICASQEQRSVRTPTYVLSAQHRGFWIEAMVMEQVGQLVERRLWNGAFRMDQTISVIVFSRDHRSWIWMALGPRRWRSVHRERAGEACMEPAAGPGSIEGI